VRTILFLAAMMAWPSTGFAQGWRKTVSVYKAGKSTHKSRKVATIRNLRRNPKNRRPFFHHLPKSNGTTVRKGDRGGASTVVLGHAGEKSGVTRATVYKNDVVAIPVASAKPTHSVRGGHFIGITKPIAKSGEGPRLMLFAPTPHAKSGGLKITVRDGKKPMKRYDIKLDHSSIAINHVLTPEGWRTQGRPVVHRR
jgi:hypothetical protein